MIEGEEIDEEFHEALSDYHSFMTEIRNRCGYVDDQLGLLLEQSADLASYTAEGCYAQLRLICETLALAVLWIHKGRPLSSNVEKAYTVRKIFNELSRVNNDFYPQPRLISPRVDGKLDVEPSEVQHLSKDELKEIHEECGAVLHRGTMKALRKREPKNFNVLWIAQNVDRIRRLLERHAVHVHGLADVFLVEVPLDTNRKVVVRRGTITD